ncbi:hypothetical protein WS86_06370 [Burkholderia savannae]|nr:hypothetical protein WS86_06370 [Burkholderia savannae]
MRRLLHRKIGSLLGLFAILMATLAPTVSHSLSNSRHSGTLPGAVCSARDGSNATPSDTSSSSEKAIHEQACAYCGLLAHVPVVPSATAEFAPENGARHASSAAPVQPIRRRVPFTTAQPRAPPALS